MCATRARHQVVQSAASSGASQSQEVREGEKGI